MVKTILPTNGINNLCSFCSQVKRSQCFEMQVVNRLKRTALLLLLLLGVGCWWWWCLVRCTIHTYPVFIKFFTLSKKKWFSKVYYILYLFSTAASCSVCTQFHWTTIEYCVVEGRITFEQANTERWTRNAECWYIIMHLMLSLGFSFQFSTDWNHISCTNVRSLITRHSEILKRFNDPNSVSDNIFNLQNYPDPLPSQKYE